MTKALKPVEEHTLREHVKRAIFDEFPFVHALHFSRRKLTVWVHKPNQKRKLPSQIQHWKVRVHHIWPKIRKLRTMEKYAVPQKDVDELVKTGACDTEEEAREQVSKGNAKKLLPAPTVDDKQGS